MAQLHQKRDLLSFIDIQDPRKFIKKSPANEVLALRFYFVSIVLLLVEVEAVIQQIFQVVEIFLRSFRLDPFLVFRLQPSFKFRIDKFIALL